ncbi:MAG: serine hydrolase, partial [Sphingomonas sp.]
MQLTQQNQEYSSDSARRLIMMGVAAMMLVGCVSSGRQPAAVATTPPPPAPLPAPAPKPVVVAAKPQPPAGMLASLEALAQGFDGRVGIAVTSIDKGWALDVHGDERLPQQSVSKLWVALTVLDFRDQGRLTLDDPVTVTREDLTLFHQPIAAMVKGDGYKTNVGDLLIRALTTSDNTANDRLLRYVGGPDAVRETIRRKALGNIRFGPGERLLQSQTAGLEWKPQYAFGNSFTRARALLPVSARLKAVQSHVAAPPDGAAPAAIAGALARLQKGELLSPDSTR